MAFMWWGILMPAFSEKGWHLDRQQFPPSLHLTVNRAHVKSAGVFLEDLRDAVRASRKEPIDRWIDRSKLAMASAVVRVLPARVVTKITESASERFGIRGAELPKRSAAMYGMMASLPNRGDLHSLVIDALDRMTRPSRPGE
jgi:hypothetical protein